MLKALLILPFLLLAMLAFPQAQPSVRLQIVGGANVVFNVNSYSKVKNGITYDDYTTVRVYFSDADESTNEWELLVNAIDANMNPDFGTKTLPLNVLKLRSSYSESDGAEIVLSDTETQLAHGIHPKTNAVKDIKISYILGENGTLFGYSSDYFSTDLVFTVRFK